MTGGPYARSRIEPVLVAAPMPLSWRIMNIRHQLDPLGTSPADSRFCTKNCGFTVLYAAPELATAFVETVVRDRFTRRRNSEVALIEITARVWAHVSMRGNATLKLLDLRGDGCTRIGAPTDTVNARNHAAGRAFAKSIHADHRDVDGIVYASRLTGADVYAVFNRAIGNLASPTSGLLEEHPELPGILTRYRIGIVA